MDGSKTQWNRSRPGRVQLVVDEYAEDLTGPQLPPEVEEYLAGEREWHRLLRLASSTPLRSGWRFESGHYCDELIGTRTDG